jgi:uncharacterized membrane protein YhaH (DUF805 family)
MQRFKNIFLLWRGRVSRKTYWLCGLVPAIVTSVIGVVLYSSPVTASFRSRLDLPLWPMLIALLVAIYIGLMLSIKRSHDLGYTGFFSLVLLVPLLNLWPLVMFGFFLGSEDENQHGPPDRRFSNVFVDE